MEKLNSDNIITENSLDLDDINLYRDINKIKQIKINEYYKDQIMLWISWSKEKQQELFMKYIESIELEMNNDKIEVGRVNFKKSFLQEYSILFFRNVIDMETNLVSKNNNSINITYLQTREEIKNYINKLRKYYDIDYYEVEVKYDENNNIYLDYESNKEDNIIKIIPIKENKKFSNKLNCGVIAV